MTSITWIFALCLQLIFNSASDTCTVYLQNLFVKSISLKVGSEVALLHCVLYRMVDNNSIRLLLKMLKSFEHIDVSLAIV